MVYNGIGVDYLRLLLLTMKHFIAMLKRNAAVLAVAGLLSFVILGFWVYPTLEHGTVDFTALYIDELKLGPSDGRWMAWNWVKSDPAYDALWVKVQKLEEPQVAKFAERQWEKYKENPNDLLALYGLTYAAMRTQSRRSRGKDPYLAISQAAVMKNFAKLPRNYEWARVRFLLTYPRRPNKSYERLARRLLQVNPKDAEVQYIYILSVANLKDAEEKENILHYLKELRRDWPKNGSFLFAEGVVYGTLWKMEEKPEYARKAIDAYQDFWEHSGANDYVRGRVRKKAEEIEQELNKKKLKIDSEDMHDYP